MMKKKFFALISVCCLLLSNISYAEWGDDRNLLDAFNNELFEVIAEFEIPYEVMFLDFKNITVVPNEDSTLAKVCELNIDYSGKVELTDITDYIDINEAYNKQTDLIIEDFYSYEEEPVYNDGLIESKIVEGESYYDTSYGYKDVSGNVKYSTFAFDYFIYDYNLGLLYESENNGFANIENEERKYLVDFTTVMTDNKTYSFDKNINCFNDDGYSIMQDGGKNYVIKLKKGIIPTVTYDGAKIKFDQIPVIEEGRTLVPLRAIFEAIGAEVSWEQETRMVTAVKDDVTVSLTIDDATADKNGEEITLDVPARIINDRTLVPVRFIADSFGVDVEWDNTMKRVVLTSKE